MGRIIPLDVRPANMPTVGQGVAERTRPRVLANLYDEGCGKDVAFLIAHPAINFLQHYLLEPLQSRGRAVMTVNTRHTNNDSALLMERCIQDVGAGVKFLRSQGYKRIILIGNSGGGPLMSLYQSQAEKLTIKTTPDGLPFDIVPDDLPPADAVVLLSAHPGRHHYFAGALDPSVLNELDPLSCDPELDMYSAKNGPPYEAKWLERYFAGQAARQHRLTAWVQGRLREFAANDLRAEDQAFIIYRTYAKPATLDHRIDPNDRPAGDMTIYGKAQAVNYSAGVFGRFTTLRSYLSQWSEISIADGPARLAETKIPVMNVEYSADEGCFPTETRRYSKVVGARCEDYVLKGAMHFPFLQKNGDAIIATLAGVLADWGKK